MYASHPTGALALLEKAPLIGRQFLVFFEDRKTRVGVAFPLGEHKNNISVMEQEWNRHLQNTCEYCYRRDEGERQLTSASCWFYLKSTTYKSFRTLKSLQKASLWNAYGTPYQLVMEQAGNSLPTGYGTGPSL
jgi:hypothetical protein